MRNDAFTPCQSMGYRGYQSYRNFRSCIAAHEARQTPTSTKNSRDSHDLICSPSCHVQPSNPDHCNKIASPLSIPIQPTKRAHPSSLAQSFHRIHLAQSPDLPYIPLLINTISPTSISIFILGTSALSSALTNHNIPPWSTPESTPAKLF